MARETPLPPSWQMPFKVSIFFWNASLKINAQLLSLISDQCWLVDVDVFFINIILIRLMLILKLLIMSKHLMPGPDVPLAMCQLCTAGNFSTYRKPRQLHTILLGMPLSKDKFRRFSTLTPPPLFRT